MSDRRAEIEARLARAFPKNGGDCLFGGGHVWSQPTMFCVNCGSGYRHHADDVITVDDVRELLGEVERLLDQNTKLTDALREATGEAARKMLAGETSE